MDIGDDHALLLAYIHLAESLLLGLPHRGFDDTRDHHHHQRDESLRLLSIVGHVLRLHMPSKRGMPPLDVKDTIVVRTLLREIAQLGINKRATIVPESARNPLYVGLSMCLALGPQSHLIVQRHKFIRIDWLR